jgi:hypothetical protein
MTYRAIVLISALCVSVSSLVAQQTSTQATYTLKATPKTVAWGYYDAKATPVLRIKSGNTVEVQTPAVSALAPEDMQLIVYVKHLEPPYYPPLPRMTRVGGTIEMKLKIGTDGRVLSVESANFGPGPAQKLLMMLKESAEANIKTWTFGCAGCPPNAPFQHTIRFKYVQDSHLPDRAIRLVMDLPDEVTMSAGPIPVEPETTSTKTKGSH